MALMFVVSRIFVATFSSNREKLLYSASPSPASASESSVSSSEISMYVLFS
jgi:hypothetical protein